MGYAYMDTDKQPQPAEGLLLSTDTGEHGASTGNYVLYFFGGGRIRAETPSFNLV